MKTQQIDKQFKWENQRQFLAYDDNLKQLVLYEYHDEQLLKFIRLKDCINFDFPKIIADNISIDIFKCKNNDFAFSTFDNQFFLCFNGNTEVKKMDDRVTAIEITDTSIYIATSRNQILNATKYNEVLFQLDNINHTIVDFLYEHKLFRTHTSFLVKNTNFFSDKDVRFYIPIKNLIIVITKFSQLYLLDLQRGDYVLKEQDSLIQLQDLIKTAQIIKENEQSCLLFIGMAWGYQILNINYKTKEISIDEVNVSQQDDKIKDIEQYCLDFSNNTIYCTTEQGLVFKLTVDQ